MKKIYLTAALVAGTLLGANAQIVFSSSFENWTGSTPDGWMGVRSNIPASKVTQVTGSSDYGNNAVRLEETTGTHKRFTTLGYTVTDGTTYQIKFWAKGQGDVRTGIMDSRSTGFGYAYNSYISVNSATWTEYTQNITCANDTTGAEFLFSIKSTVAPNHIMLDSVVISEATASTVSIYGIQYTTIGGGASPLAGATVNTGGIVTAKYSNGYYLQSGAGAWRGIKVFDAGHSPMVGDSVVLTAQVQENFNNTELTAVSAYALVNSGNPLPGPAIITTTQGNTEDFEGVYTRVTSVCKDANAGFGMWSLYSSPDTLKVDDVMYPFTPTFNETYQVTGVIEYSFSEFKILPRNAADVVLIMSVNEENKFAGLKMYPNPADEVVMLSGLPTNSSVQVVDLTGKTMMTTNTAVLNTGVLANGLYLVKVTNDNVSKTYKLVVKH